MSFIAKVYVAGPYSKGNSAKNVENAIMIANQLADLGFAPYTPHFTHYWHIKCPRPYEFWSKLHNEFLQYCDAGRFCTEKCPDPQAYCFACIRVGFKCKFAGSHSH